MSASAHPSSTDPAPLVTEVLNTATAGEVIVGVTVSGEVNSRWAMSMPTTNGSQFAETITITAIAPSSDGASAATRSGPVALWRELLAQAEVAAREGSPTLDHAPLLPGSAQPGWTAPPADMPMLDVPDALVAAFAQDSDTEYFGYAEESAATTYVGTSTGWRWRSQTRSARFELCGKQAERTRSAWHGAAGERLSDVDAQAAVADVRAGLAQQRQPVRLEAAPTTVILTPSAVADLLLCLWWEADARAAAEGRSAFSGDGPGGTSLGSVLSQRQLSLRSDPHAEGMSAPDRLWAPFSGSGISLFDTGSAIGDVAWIADGRLAALITSRGAAAEFGIPAHVPAENLLLADADGHGTLADVIARTDRALLITSLWYIRDVDPQQLLVTGLTRDGTYLVTDGQITGATGNFRFNDSPLDMLTRILDAGDPVRCLPREWADYFSRTTMPPLVVAEFGLSTASSAV